VDALASAVLPRGLALALLSDGCGAGRLYTAATVLALVTSWVPTACYPIGLDARSLLTSEAGASAGRGVSWQGRQLLCLPCSIYTRFDLSQADFI
jgi:hypothetical protein